jgi:Uma2 family endonuclease
LIVEIFSPFERLETVNGRISMFLSAGTREAWLVDPAKRSVRVFRPGQEPVMLLTDDSLSGGTVLPGFAIRVADLFSEYVEMDMGESSPITVEEFETMPLDGSWELIDGKLVESNLAVEMASCVSATIVAILGRFVRSHRLGRVYSAGCGFVLFPDRDTVRVPDVAFVRAERAPHGEARRHFPRLAPDLAVEVLSPSDLVADAIAKVGMYLQAGVSLVWLVAPFDSIITVFHKEGLMETLRVGETLGGYDVLPGLSVPLAEVFEASGD